jgi:hypothetical protein
MVAKAAPKLVRAVRSFRPDPPELEYVVLEGAELPADHPAVVAHPTFFEPVSKGTAK